MIHTVDFQIQLVFFKFVLQIKNFKLIVGILVTIVMCRRDGNMEKTKIKACEPEPHG